MTFAFNDNYQYKGGNLLIGCYVEKSSSWSNFSFYGKTVSGACVHGRNTDDFSSITATRYDFLPTVSFGYDLVELADNTDNTTVICNNTGADKNVILAGRTLYKDGKWNTLCLPFDLNISGSILDGDNVDVRTLSSSDFDSSTGVLTLNFTNKGDVTTLDAGTPYIIKWSKTNESAPDLTNLTDPTFKGVTINNSVNNVSFTHVQFIGTYSPIVWETENKGILLVGGNNLYYPQPSGGQNPRINAFRAYFKLNGITNASEFVLNFDDETTGVRPPSISPKGENTEASPWGGLVGVSWYDLSGRKLDQQPTQKGLYIHSGRKTVIK